MALAEILQVVISVLIGAGVIVGGTYAMKRLGGFTRYDLKLPTLPAAPEYLLPEGMEELAPTTREAVEGWIDKKWAACTQSVGRCEICEFYDKDPAIVSHCAVDRYILVTVEETTKTEHELWAHTNKQILVLTKMLETVEPKLDMADRNFGDLAWLRKMILAFIVLNSGMIITGVMGLLGGALP